MAKKTNKRKDRSQGLGYNEFIRHMSVQLGQERSELARVVAMAMANGEVCV